MNAFDLLAQGRLDELKSTLLGDPALAAARHGSGASLLAWAYYVGQPSAATFIRPHLGPLDPYDAIIVGDITAVKAALDGGWDGNALSPDGFTPLGLTAFFNQPQLFELLLPITRDVNEPARNAQRVAAIHAATAVRNAAMVEKLLKAGADPNQAQADQFTPLHVAAEHGDLPIAAMLVLYGGDPRARDGKGKDAIEHARAGGHEWLALRLEAIAAR